MRMIDERKKIISNVLACQMSLYINTKIYKNIACTFYASHFMNVTMALSLHSYQEN